mmetsp:Transcript_6925/g.16974  ORF Transcript_6925/g.16974 Transcript_6925/m.16974 type:complete len:266 (+) Transcript_6925:2749-3546(+)
MSPVPPLHPQQQLRLRQHQHQHQHPQQQQQQQLRLHQHQHQYQRQVPLNKTPGSLHLLSQRPRLERLPGGSPDCCASQTLTGSSCQGWSLYHRTQAPLQPHQSHTTMFPSSTCREEAQDLHLRFDRIGKDPNQSVTFRTEMKVLIPVWKCLSPLRPRTIPRKMRIGKCRPFDDPHAPAAPRGKHNLGTQVNPTKAVQTGPKDPVDRESANECNANMRKIVETLKARQTRDPEASAFARERNRTLSLPKVCKNVGKRERKLNRKFW